MKISDTQGNGYQVDDISFVIGMKQGLKNIKTT
jgi:hypothetical protein